MSEIFGLIGLIFILFVVPTVFLFVCLKPDGMPSDMATDTEKTIKVGFWKRQFQASGTPRQKIFDWFFGAIMPVICFFFDPIVFTNMGILEDYKPFAYILSFTSVMAISAWLIWGEKLKWFNAILSGLFAVCGIVSLAIGIALFPISLVGLIFVIGVLGFTPLFTAIVFLRNSVRAFGAAKPFFEKKILIYAMVLSSIYWAVVPAVVNVQFNRMKEARKATFSTEQMPPDFTSND